MRVLLVNEGIGGHDTVHLHLGTALERRTDVEIVELRVPSAGLPRRLVGAAVPGLGRLDLDLQPIRAQLAASAWLRRRIRPLLEWCDVVHVYTPTVAYLLGDLLAEVPCVMTTDTTATENARRLPYRSPTVFTRVNAAIGRRFERRALASADVVIANTAWVHDRLTADHDLGGTDVLVQPFGITDPGHPTGPAHGTALDRPRFVFVGRQWRRKGAGDLLDLWAAELHAVADLVLVTPEPVPATPGVSVVDDIVPGDPRLPALLRESTAFVFPSAIDQAPNAVLEALAAGLPCVVAAQAGAAEMVEHEVSGLHVRPGDPAGLRDAVLRLVQHPDERARMGAAAQRRFRERYDAVVTADAFVAACERALAVHRGVDTSAVTTPAPPAPRSLAGPLSAVRTAARGRRRSPGGLVVGYHDVRADPAGEWDVSPDGLLGHVDVLRRHGFRFVALDDMVRRLRRGAPIDGLASVTFDDALVGVLDVLPALERRDVPVTVFSTTVDIGRPPQWWPGARRTLRADELRDLAAAGVAIGSHGRTHRSMRDLCDEALAGEVAGSCRELEAITGRPVTTLAYPHGHHDARVRDAVRAADLLGAVTFSNGRVGPGTDPTMLPRLTAGPHLSAGRLRYHVLRSAESWPAA